ncbi:MAG: HlyD family efflux transporter periplasmic adaptor subunit [Emcibacter sp.]|nr:HlyD family efflux transporter periplasmic adaptor subunit [Emcibacter sp.]
MPAKYWRYILVLFLFVGGGSLIFYFSVNNAVNTTSSNQRSSLNSSITYQEYPVTYQKFSNGISLTGITAPKQEETVLIPSNIHIDKILVAIGEHVNAGEKLVQLDEISYSAIIGNTKATYLEQLKNYNRAKNWKTSPEVTRMKNSLEEIKLRLEQSRKTLESVKNLLDKGLIPRQEYDANKLAVLRDELALENSRNELNMRLATSKENLEIAELRYKSAKSTWLYFQKNYPDASIRAPITGYVGRPPQQGRNTQTDPNGYQSTTGKPVFTILATDRLLIQAYIGEKDVNHVIIGQSVLIKDIGGESVNISGKVTAISRVNSSSDKSFPRFEFLVEVDPKELGNRLRFGLSATIFIKMQTTDNAIFIPIEAVQDDGNGPYVLVKTLSENGSFKKNVEIGKATYDNIEIFSGLNNGDILLVPENK